MTGERPTVITKRRRKHAGFTLVEATIALVILGMAAAGVLLPFASGASVQAEGLRVTLGAKLANDLLERIVATPASQIVAAWHGYAEAQGQVKDAGGAVFADPMYANFSRSVTCQDAQVAQQSLASNFILVTVQVRYEGREIATLRRLINK
jgi:prepilin-type N-terminal cleavage/methylation domain-containing protein